MSSSGGTQAEERGDIRRILVAIDGSPHSLAALKLAADLASKIEAELIGMYVEDINLLRLAELPITREVGFYSARVREIDVHRIKRQLRGQARRAEQALALIAESVEVRWSFHIAQGLIPAEILAAATDIDLVILGKSGWSRRRRLGSTAQTLVVQSERQILIFQAGVRLTHPVLVIYDGSQASKKALNAALNVLEDESLLTVLISAQDAEEVKKLQSDVQEWAQIHDIYPQYRWTTEINASVVANQAWSIGCGFLILPAGSGFLPSKKLIGLLNQTDCAVYLVR
ncbi:MAG TPA: universal stress protein [Anaerolineales bacterium]